MTGMVHFLQNKKLILHSAIIALAVITLIVDEQTIVASDLSLNQGASKAAIVATNAKENVLAFYERTGDWNAAVTNFSKMIKRDGSAKEYYQCRATAYFMLGQYTNALYDITQVIRLDNRNATNFANRANIYYSLKEYSKAVEDFGTACELDKHYYLALIGRASAYVELGQRKNALKDLNFVVSFAPNDSKALTLRGDVLFKEGDYQRALSDYQKAIFYDPQDPKAYNGLAWLRSACPLNSLRNGHEAVNAALRACELSKWRFWGFVDTLAAAYAESGDFQSAKYYEQKAVKMNNQNQECLKTCKKHMQFYNSYIPYYDRRSED